MKPYELVRHTSPADGEAFVEGFASRATGVTRIVRTQGGFWELSFTLPLEIDKRRVNDFDYLKSEWFDSALFHRIIMRVGGAVVWRGVVWDMELTYPFGIKQRRSYGDIFNAVRTDYLDTSSAQQSTSWYTDSISIARYGRREYIHYMSDSDSTTAESAAQAILKDNKSPWARLVNVNPELTPGLTVTAVGDIWTANNKYVGSTTLDDATGNISAYIDAIVDNDCDYVSAVHIQSNTLQATRTNTMPVRAWDLIQKLTAAGDSSFNRWESYVDAGGFVYQQSSNTPNLYWFDDARVTDAAKKSGPEVYWSMWPGVMRTMALGRGDNLPGAGLQDARDSWIVELQMSDDAEQPVPKSDDADAEDVINRQRGLVQRDTGSDYDVAGLLERAGDVIGGDFYG